MTIILIVMLYLCVGAFTLAVFDLCTHRLRVRLRNASVETQGKMLEHGTPVRRAEALTLTIVALLVLWPLVLVGATQGALNGKKR